MIWQSRFSGQPYIIAELGVNHGGSRARAISMIRLAASAGADAVKFQAYQAEKLAAARSPSYFQQTGEAALTQREFFQRYDSLEPEDYRQLADVAAEAGVDFLCTPFDEEAVSWLFPLVKGYKIASADITHWPLLHAITGTRKPVILSTGAATWDEIDRAMRWLLESGTPHLTLLHCVLSYPTAYKDANLGLIRKLHARFPDCGAGYSDHTLASEDLPAVVVAAHLGAQVIEKHFTDDPTEDGNDHYHSMTPQQLENVRRILGGPSQITPAMEMLIGNADRAECLPCEREARQQARRSLYTTRALKAGHILELGDLAAKRPVAGLEPFHLPAVMGRALAHDVDEEEALQWTHLA